MDLEAAGLACGVVDGCGFFKIEGCVKCVDLLSFFVLYVEGFMKCVDFLFFDFCKWRAL